MPDPVAVAASDFSGYPPLPVPGPALAQRLAVLPAAGRVSQAVSVRPDGRVVATGGFDIQTSGGGSFQYRPNPVVLFDCASGRQWAALAPITNAADAASPESYLGQREHGQLLRWSPDGKYLLFVDSAYGAGTIWGPGSLPH